MKAPDQPSSFEVVTLKDVAEAAGVHISTVSRVLNPSRRKMVSSGVAERVHKIANEMGYVANPFAYGLRTKKSNTIGVVIPDLANPIFPPIIRGIEFALRRTGHTAIFTDSNENEEEEDVILERLLSRQVEGLIIATAHKKLSKSTEESQKKLPIVLVNRGTKTNQILSITNDDFLGATKAVEHLIELGHTRIAHLAGPQTLTTGFQRRKGYQEAMKKHGIPSDKDLIVSCGGFGFEDGKKGFEKLRKRDVPFTAIFAANDFLALGCYHQMRKHEILCPEDISIIGYNDMPFSDMFQPALTTMRIDLYNMGVQAAELLTKIMSGERNNLESDVLTPELIVRGSTAPV